MSAYLPQTPREARIADDARRSTLREVENWLREKAKKAQMYPGADTAEALSRAGAYHNAAEQVKRWAADD